MKVLLIHNYYREKGGGEDAVFESEAKLLKDHGHDVVQLTEDNNDVSREGKAKATLNAIWSVQSYKKIATLLKRESFDILHAHNTFLRFSPAVYYASRESRTPIVQTLHNYRIICPAATLYRDGKPCELCLSWTITLPGVLHRCYHASFTDSALVTAMIGLHRGLQTWKREVDAYITPSKFARSMFIKAGLPEEKLYVKPHFISDPGEYRIGKSPARKYFLFAGRLSIEKGAATLLHVMQRMDDVEILVVGDGPLRDQFSSTQLDKRHQYLGYRPKAELLSLMAGSIALLYPSEVYETFGLSIVEAFSCGTSVIASSHGALGELVEHGKTGLLFTPGNVDELTSKIRWAFNHQSEMLTMGIAARAFYEKEFMAEPNYNRLMQVYEHAKENRNRAFIHR